MLCSFFEVPNVNCSLKVTSLRWPTKRKLITKKFFWPTSIRFVFVNLFGFRGKAINSNYSWNSYDKWKQTRLKIYIVSRILVSKKQQPMTRWNSVIIIIQTILSMKLYSKYTTVKKKNAYDGNPPANFFF